MHNGIGVNINLGFAHSMVQDVAANKVYLYGGLRVNSFSPNNLSFSLISPKPSWSRAPKEPLEPDISSHFYEFDVVRLEWRELPKSTFGSYMHSSVLFKDLVLTFGGVCLKYNSDDSRFNSDQLRFYSIKENKWFELAEYQGQESLSKLKFKHRARYGHSSFIYNNSLFVFAGFNGFFLDDLFKINLNFLNQDIQGQVKKRQIIYPTNGDGPILLQEPFYQDLISVELAKTAHTNLAKKQLQKDLLGLIESCHSYISCASCHMDVNCVWNMKRCEYFSTSANPSTEEVNQIERAIYKKPTCSHMCSEFKNCANCTQGQSECVWCSNMNKCLLRQAIQVIFRMALFVEESSSFI